MSIEKLEKSGWHAYFEALSKVLHGKEALMLPAPTSQGMASHLCSGKQGVYC